jgi:flavin-dependent dehydrogenase
VATAFTRAQLSIAAGVYAHGPSSDRIDLRFATSPAGYLWSFPRPGHLAAGACAAATEGRTPELQAATRRWLAEAGLAVGARLEPYAWPIPSLSAHDVATSRPAGPRWLLVGDAAGLVDPITREGIYFALASAEAAAAALGAGGDVAATYRRALDQHIHPELGRAARLKAGFFRGPFMRLLVQALRESAGVRSVMADLVAGTQPYATLRRRLLSTFEFWLAWRLARLRFAASPAAVPAGESVLP